MYVRMFGYRSWLRSMQYAHSSLSEFQKADHFTNMSHLAVISVAMIFFSVRENDKVEKEKAEYLMTLHVHYTHLWNIL